MRLPEKEMILFPSYVQPFWQHTRVSETEQINLVFLLACLHSVTFADVK